MAALLRVVLQLRVAVLLLVEELHRAAVLLQVEVLLPVDLKKQIKHAIIKK